MHIKTSDVSLKIHTSIRYKCSSKSPLIIMYLSMEEKFQTACHQVRNFTKRPPDSDMLELYSLFKQATIGNINIAKPTDAKGKSKWDAWNSRKGMSQAEAKENYIELARNFASKYE